MREAGRVERWERVPAVLGQKIRRMRRVLGLSQEELALQAHVSQGAVSRLESGNCAQMSFHTVAAVFCALVVAYAPHIEKAQPDIRQVIAVVVGVWPTVVEDHGWRIFEEPGLQLLVEGYCGLDQKRQKLFIELVQPLLEMVMELSDHRVMSSSSS